MIKLPRSRAALVVVLLALGLIPLGLLAYFSVHIAGTTVGKRVEENLQATAAASALYIDEELRGLAEVDESFASRPYLREALAGRDQGPWGRARIRETLEELSGVRPGIGTAFLASPSGRLVDIVPETPAIIRKNFSFRDWFKGVTASGAPYVSEAYRSQAAGEPLVVAIAAPIWAPGSKGPDGKLLGILVVAYRIETIQAFADRFARARGVAIAVTDQRGVLVADPNSPPRQLVTDHDEQVVRALAGGSGVSELTKDDEKVISAFTPVPDTGWTVRASTPTKAAFAPIGELRWTVTLISALLASLIAAAAWFLARAIRRRQLAEDQTRAVLDSTRDGIAFLDLEGRILLTNAAMRRMAQEVLNVRAEGTMLDRSREIADYTTDPDGYRASVEAMANDPDHVGLYEYELLSGAAVQRYTAPVRDSSDAIAGRIVVLRDVTGEHDAERMKNELMATVSHELRTPLASILGFSELLVARELDEETRTRYLGTIYREAERLTALINDFLDLQRIEESGLTLSLEPFDLGDLLREEIELFSAQSSAHTLELELPEESTAILGESDRIVQVVANFLSNAIKYSPNGGTIRVSAEETEMGLRVSVADKGLGIPREQQRKIFTKFFRVDSSDTRRIGGTGLGLALCREIVEAHGGRIGFESVEGEGSTFWFELPAGRRRAVGGRPRLLVIEDDPAAAELLERYLGEDGYDLDIVATGEEGLKRIQTGAPPALVCLDIRLGGEMDGWEVLVRLKDAAHSAGVPVLVLTAYGGREHAAVLGASDFLAKPFTATQLRRAVERLLPVGGRTVLVVDDEESVRRLVSETLCSQGLELREATDGEDALAAISEHVPDAIVLDLVMPNMDGFAVLERLQEDSATRGIPVLVLTARRLTPAERLWLRSRAQSVLEKSEYSARELREFVLQALGAESASLA